MRCAHARRVQRRKERREPRGVFETLPKPNIPRLNPDRPGPEGSAETAHSAVTTLNPSRVRSRTPRNAIPEED